jgi:hypothetical protein
VQLHTCLILICNCCHTEFVCATRLSVNGVVQHVLTVRVPQAVAGVVGCAELICAAWSIPALLLYFMAVDGRYAAAAAAAAAAGVMRQQQHHDAGTALISSKHSGSKSRPQRGRSAAEAAAAAAHAAEAAEKDARKLRTACAVQHWLLVFAAAGLAVLAALSKEIGITITGTMVLYDLLLAPHVLQSSGKVIFSSAAADGGEASSGSKQQQQRQRVCRSQLLRVLLLAVVTVGYIKLRSWVAVQQLVDIYRKVRHAEKWGCAVYKDFVEFVVADWRVVCCIAQQQHPAYVVLSFDFAVGICQRLCSAGSPQRRIRCSSCCCCSTLACTLPCLFRCCRTQVENPIPFAKPLSTRLLSTGYLHARYFGLLLLPLHLSADWSFSCIPLVEHLTDPRNVATAALYMYFLYVGLAVQPLQFLRQLWGVVHSALLAPAAGGDRHAAAKAGNGSSRDKANSSSSTTPAVAAAVDGRLGHARWRLMVVVGLLVAPYFPASNVLFYVGTFIGERLLYFPSIGYCLLVADILGWLLRPSSAVAAVAVQQQQQQQQRVQSSFEPEAKVQADSAPAQDDAAAAAAADSDPNAAAHNVPNASSSSSSRQRVSAGAVVAVLLVLSVCCGYAVRTLLRNADWWDEERLFIAAQQVCPNSAKVQQNSGVLQRRYQNFSGALRHFR